MWAGLSRQISRSGFVWQRIILVIKRWRRSSKSASVEQKKHWGKKGGESFNEFLIPNRVKLEISVSATLATPSTTRVRVFWHAIQTQQPGTNTYVRTPPVPTYTKRRHQAAGSNRLSHIIYSLWLWARPIFKVNYYLARESTLQRQTVHK